MRIGYVSDECYLALPGVWVEVRHAGGISTTQSSASGAIDVDAPPGVCTVLLNCPGYGAKRVKVEIGNGHIHQFRLLSDGLLGYVWPKWSRAGEGAEFRVHSPESYKLGLWRYGWEKEFIRNLGWFDDHGPRPTIQTVPDGDFTQWGVQWNREGYALRWHPQRVITPDRSGLYYFHAKTASGLFFNFPWIVMPSKPQAKIAVLCSNITWNAYNNFGGRSNYVNQDALPPEPVLNARQDLRRFTEPGVWPFEDTAAPLSFDRPELFNVVPEDATITDPVGGRLQPAMAPAEWRLLGWLEREGFAYDLYSETELHFGRIPLDEYAVVILNTHNEYFSKEMYFQVKEWVYQRGGKLIYFGGAGLQAELEFDDDYTIRCRQELIAEHRKESAACLLGVEYTHEGFQSGAPFCVLDGGHWIFANTGLREGDLFGIKSLHERCPGGASAHELDKINESSPKNLQHLAKGTNGDNNGADMTYYETESGGAVFAVGALAWTLSLVVDEPASAITANVLRRFLGN